MSDWKADLANFLNDKEKKNQINAEKLISAKESIAKFFSETVMPTFEELKVELEKHQREVVITSNKEHATIIVNYKGHTEISYSIKINIHSGGVYPFPEIRFIDPTDGKMYKAEGVFRSGAQDYDISQITKDEIIQSFLNQYKLHLPD